MPELVPEQMFRMFYLHHNPTYTPDPIVIGPSGSPENRLILRLEWHTSIPGEDGRPEWQPAELGPDELAWNCRPAWVVEFGQRRRGRLFLDMVPEMGIHWGNRSDRNLIQYLSANGLDSMQLGRLYDQVAVREGMENVLYALRLMAPDVEEVLLVGEGFARQVLLRVKDASEPVPLRSLGDGMNRILGIILALVNAKNGLLLVDEIENGIHYSVIPELWRLIFRVAAELNVQVFATTHSWDCIEGFQKAAVADHNNVGMLIRLERRKGDIRATLFDEEELTTATRERIEVR